MTISADGKGTRGAAPRQLSLPLAKPRKRRRITGPRWYAHPDQLDLFRKGVEPELRRQLGERLWPRSSASWQRLRPCYSCGSRANCRPGCRCAKCRNPAAYDAWRRDDPRDYAKWLAAQMQAP